ncbi:MAG TPA: hypothetical protein DCY95_10580, partial [Algoriphagus sp.]|nr:hypothetical protein [Algoriphagus sp.]
SIYFFISKPVLSNSSIPTAWRGSSFHFATKLKSQRDLSYSQINLCAFSSWREKLIPQRMEEAKFEIESKRLFQEAKPTLFRVAYFDLFLYF